MARRYSIAEARQELPRLVRRLERGRPLEITRLGKPVAVLMSAAEYLRLEGERPSFNETVRGLRSRLAVESLGIADEDFRSLREAGPGRKAAL
jgi:prevent-host-death family protein